MRPQPRSTLPPIEDLLTSGGDARIVRGPNGVNKYGCFAAPDPELLSYSSSTASTISPAGFAAATVLYRRLEKGATSYAAELSRMRGELTDLCELSTLSGLDIIFGASGTDLHLFVAQLLSQNHSLLALMPEPSETGSGVGMALSGCHYSTQTALGSIVTASKALANAIPIASIRSRNPDGSLRPVAEVDAEVEALVTQAITSGQHVLLTLTDVTKTGLITPSPACAIALRKRFSAKLDVLVDACQFRLANTTVRAYLEQDFLLAMTGSKFVGGPAFCAALLVPAALAQKLRACPLPAALSAYSARADWPQNWSAREALADTANWGLLLRFEAALAELRTFHAMPQAHIQPFLERFAEAILNRLRHDPAFAVPTTRGLDRNSATWDSIPTIFPFLLRHPQSGAYFTPEETQHLYERMKKDFAHHPAIPAPLRPLAARRCLLGQPVTCGPYSALRLNLDMRLIADALSPAGRGPDAIIAEALSVLDKAALLAQYRII